MAASHFSTKLKFVMYGLIGGFYHSAEFRPWMKYIWLLVNGLTFFISTVFGCYGYWIITDKKTFSDEVFTFATANINIFSVIVIPLTTYRYKNELEAILHFVENEWSKRTISECRARRQRAQKLPIYMIALFSAFAAAIILLHPALMLWYGSSKLHTLQHYVYPIPYIHRINSMLVYFLIATVHCTCAFLIVSVLVVVPSFLMIIAFEFYVAFGINGDRLEKFAAKAQSDLDECHKKYSYFKSTNHSEEFREQMVKLQLRLLQRISRAARDHQKLLRCIYTSYNVIKLVEGIKPDFGNLHGTTLVGTLKRNH